MSLLELQDLYHSRKSARLAYRPVRGPETPKQRSMNDAAVADRQVQAPETPKLGSTKGIADRLTELKNFNSFPMEIRHYIWHLSASAPRVIEITEQLVTEGNKSRARELRLSTNALAPAIMHVCVDSRNAGKRVYQPLVLNGGFTGTYVDWKTDFILFGKSEGNDSLEGSVSATILHSDLVLNVQRLAVSPNHINNFVRVQSDPQGEITVQAPGLVLCYPNLKEVALVARWAGRETDTANMSIRPKRLVPPKGLLPEYFCPSTNISTDSAGAPVLQNRWHQSVSWMRIVPGPGKLLTESEKPKLAIVHAQPNAPERLHGLSRLSLDKLKSLCSSRGILHTGTRSVLIQRLNDDKANGSPLAKARYHQDLRKWAGFMLGHADCPSGKEFSQEVKTARADAVTKILH